MNNNIAEKTDNNKPICELCGTQDDVQWLPYRAAHLCSKCHVKIKGAEDAYKKKFGKYPDFGKAELMSGETVNLSIGNYYKWLVGNL